jgi:hypothetical protein
VCLELALGGEVAALLGAALPEPLAAWLTRENVDLRQLTTRTDPGGAFSFAGFAPGL